MTHAKQYLHQKRRGNGVAVFLNSDPNGIDDNEEQPIATFKWTSDADMFCDTYQKKLDTDHQSAWEQSTLTALGKMACKIQGDITDIKEPGNVPTSKLCKLYALATQYFQIT